MKSKKFNTKVIHAGHGADESTGSVMPPINLSSTFQQKNPGEFKYEYARTKNPTRDILEKLIAEVEGGERAFAFASGMAAINTLCEIFGTSCHVDPILESVAFSSSTFPNHGNCTCPPVPVSQPHAPDSSQSSGLVLATPSLSAAFLCNTLDPRWCKHKPKSQITKTVAF